MVVVLFICFMYIVLVFGLLFYVKNDWCDLLFKNMTVGVHRDASHMPAGADLAGSHGVPQGVLVVGGVAGRWAGA